MGATWIKGTDLLIVLSNFRNTLTEEGLLDKAITAYAYDDEDDTELASKLLTYYPAVGQVPHYYAGVIDDDTPNIELGMTVRIEVPASGGTGLQGSFVDRVRVVSGDE